MRGMQGEIGDVLSVCAEGTSCLVAVGGSCCAGTRLENKVKRLRAFRREGMRLGYGLPNASL
jgi:hypothetical protein